MGQDWWVLTELWRSLRCPQPARSWVQAAFPKPELQCLKGNKAPRSDTYISWFLCLLPLLKQNWCCLLLKQLERDYLGIPHPKQIERDCLGFPQSTMLFMFSHFCLVCLVDCGFCPLLMNMYQCYRNLYYGGHLLPLLCLWSIWRME